MPTLRAAFAVPLGLRPSVICSCRGIRRYSSDAANGPAASGNDDDFRVLDLRKSSRRWQRDQRNRPRGPPGDVSPPRFGRMPIDQDWGSVWPAARSFHPASVPLPLRMGYVQKGVPPGKFANAELMKIPNFLHLTPPVVARQCEALKKFCTPWPEGLETEEDIRAQFPLEFASSDYLHSGSSIRDSNSRIVTLRYKLSGLKLDKRGKDKYLRLVGERYDEKSDVVTIVVDRCPSKKQNRDFARYVFSVLYMEATRIEDWESEKTLADLEEFVWRGSGSESRVLDIVRKLKQSNSCPPAYSGLPDGENLTAESIANLDVVRNYACSVKTVLEQGESDETWDNYKSSVLDLLGMRRASN